MIRILALLILPMLLLAAGCSDDISAPGDDNDDQTPPNVVTVDNGDGSFTTTVASGGMEDNQWVYFSFTTRDEVEPENPADSDEWHLHIGFAFIELNGGINGIADMALVPFDDSDYANLAQAPADGYITDVVPPNPPYDLGLAFDAPPGWYTYSGPPDHLFTVNEDHYYAIRLDAENYVKLRIDDFFDGAGTWGYPKFTWEPIAVPE